MSFFTFLKNKSLFYVVILLMTFSFCEDPIEPDPVEWPSRYEKIPADAVKMTPETDNFPPVLHSEEWNEPVPMEGPVNTAGAEDAPVITPDGLTFFLFFTPDVDIPPESQLLDSVTGIWWTEKSGGEWSEPERILLNDDLALDGPFCIVADTLWFGSFRVGNYGEDGDIYTTIYDGEKWTNWQNAGERINSQYNVGELYLPINAREMIFHRAGFGGYGEYDLWKSEKVGDEWIEPVNLGPTVNSELNDSHPFISSDGTELWFTGVSKKGYPGPALFRSVKSDTGWSVPDEIISSFAGDPGLDEQGNIYFTHHFFSSEMKMIEADIYVAYKK